MGGTVMHPAASSSRTWLTFALTAYLLLGPSAPAWPGDLPDERATLKGLTTLRVRVEELEPDAERDGLTASQILTDVELRLQKAGLMVSDSANEILYVRVNARNSQQGFYSYSIRVEVLQAARLVRDPKILWGALTWSDGTIGMVGAANLKQVRDGVADIVDKFITAYLEQNPKR